MASGASAGAAAIRIDAGHIAAHRSFHHRPASFDLDCLFGAVGQDEFYLRARHQPNCFMGMEVSASFSGAILALAEINFLPIIYSGAALTASTAATAPSRR